MIRFSVLLMVISMNIGPAIADSFPTELAGKWTNIKGNCKEMEAEVVITSKSINRYESVCKIAAVKNVNLTKDNRLFHRFKVRCNSEEIKSKGVIDIFYKAEDELEVVDDGHKETIYKCKGR